MVAGLRNHGRYILYIEVGCDFKDVSGMFTSKTWGFMIQFDLPIFFKRVIQPPTGEKHQQ